MQPKDVPIEVGSALQAFALMTGFHSRGRTDDVPYHLQLLHYTLVVEQLSPVRIIWAYGGYKTQSGLREAMIRMLNEALADDALGSGFGVPCFPHMISCNGISLVKANGQPYSPPVEKGVWPFLLSSVTNPVWLMLELIWAKIENVYQISMPIRRRAYPGSISSVLVSEARRAGWTGGLVLQGRGLEEPGRCSQAYH